MLHVLPTELTWTILHYLEYKDIAELESIGSFMAVVTPYLQTHYRFHSQVAHLLRFYESLTPGERQKPDGLRQDLAQQLLHVLCHHVQQCTKFEQRAKFTQLLNVLQQLVVQRVLSPVLPDGLDKDYALLCLDIRHRYLHTASIRGLHDPKYRRRSTKHPLAPFLPRDYTWLWRQQCASMNDWISPLVPPLSTSWVTHPALSSSPAYRFLLRRRKISFQFARFFGMLFDITSLYLESNLDGTFEECVRESLVSGNIEGLLLLCVASDRPVDVDMMCLSVSHAGEQLWNYLDTMDDWMSTHPTPEQIARQEQQEQQQQQQQQQQQGEEDLVSPPEWLMPDRYKIHSDTKSRLKMINYLHQEQGWRWFP